MIVLTQKYIAELEEIQRRATKMLGGGWRTFLRRRGWRTDVGLASQEKRQLREDMTEVYKAMHGVEKVERRNLLLPLPSY